MTKIEQRKCDVCGIIGEAPQDGWILETTALAHPDYDFEDYQQSDLCPRCAEAVKSLKAQSDNLYRYGIAKLREAASANAAKLPALRNR